MLQPTQVVTVLLLLQIHLVRRLVETYLIMVYPSGARMHLIAYVFGLSYYTGDAVNEVGELASQGRCSGISHLNLHLTEAHVSPFGIVTLGCMKLTCCCLITAVVPLSLIPQRHITVLISRLFLLRPNEWLHSALHDIYKILGDWGGQVASIPPVMLAVSRYCLYPNYPSLSACNMRLPLCMCLYIDLVYTFPIHETYPCG